MTQHQITAAAAVYGYPPRELVDDVAGAAQLSPLSPGSLALEDVAAAAFSHLTILAPPGAIERRYVLAHALRVTRPGADLVILAPKDRGGSRLRKELEGFGVEVSESARRHHRICTLIRPETLQGLDQAMAEGLPRLDPNIGLWTQPGVFSWDRIDPGSRLLAGALPTLKGDGADLGCGVGYLAHTVLSSATVTRLSMIDIDRRAVDCARRNVDDPRVKIDWADVRSTPMSDLDFVVMNPPFHEAGEESKRLGQAFIRAAATALRKGGALFMVANRHLPYETALKDAFTQVQQIADNAGYKVFEARR